MDNESEAGRQLIVLAKAPALGLAKTRLAATLGPQQALEAHRELLTVLAGNLAGLENVVFCVTPDDSAAAFQDWRQPRWRVWPQGEGDLGARLSRAFQRCFQEGAERVVIIGADCPQVRPEHVCEAWRALGAADLALGPARDGGYWLIGLSRFVPRLFEDMPWSGPTLFERTMEAASSQKLRVAPLETLADIDTAQDWLAWKKRAEGGSAPPVFLPPPEVQP